MDLMMEVQLATNYLVILLRGQSHSQNAFNSIQIFELKGNVASLIANIYYQQPIRMKPLKLWKLDDYKLVLAGIYIRKQYSFLYMDLKDKKFSIFKGYCDLEGIVLEVMLMDQNRIGIWVSPDDKQFCQLWYVKIESILAVGQNDIEFRDNNGHLISLVHENDIENVWMDRQHGQQ